MNQKQRMQQGLPYKSALDGLKEAREACQLKLYDYNRLRPDEYEQRDILMRSILGKAGSELHIEAPFRCDYGSNIEVGDQFYANYNCTILDGGKVTIGHEVMFAPNVSLYTAGHPIHHIPRNAGYEYALPITIGDNVWIGGNAVITPGVTIGDNVVIGAGSVVTKHIPANVVAAGNPCRVIRTITEQDRAYYYRDRPFDITADDL
ncbi:sugar O-acetyltransferase [Paenibacillus campi]|uniref:sugar O-acetyltransferase n=1 Tax=Paenibacillus campi TaxID=3106031 RepID=UPI002AFDF8A4|nr:sugar O-acetyltransferase [Paenibacillus sp. SGZ-1009]